MHGRIEVGGGTAQRAGRRCGAVEVVVEVLDPRGEVRGQGALDAAARNPPEVGIGMAAEARASCNTAAA